MKDPKLEKVLETQRKEIDKLEAGETTAPTKNWENDKTMRYLIVNEKKVLQTLASLPGHYVNAMGIGNHRYMVGMREDHELTRKAIYAIMQLYNAQYKVEVIGEIHCK